MEKTMPPSSATGSVPPRTPADIPGLGPIRVRALQKAGLITLADLRAARLEDLLAVSGLTEIKARHIQNYLAQFPAEAPEPEWLVKAPKKTDTPVEAKTKPTAAPVETKPEQADRLATAKPKKAGALTEAKPKKTDVSTTAKPEPVVTLVEAKSEKTVRLAAPKPKRRDSAPPEPIAASAPPEPIAEAAPQSDPAFDPDSASMLIMEATQVANQVASLLTSGRAAQLRPRLVRALTHCTPVIETLRSNGEELSEKGRARAARQLRRVLSDLADLVAHPDLDRKAQARIADSLDEASDKLARA